MLHNICISAVVMSLIRWASRGPWASCWIISPWNFVRHKECDHYLTWKQFRISSWNFIWISVNIRQWAKHKNHNSCIYTFWVISFGTWLVNINVLLNVQYNMTSKRGENLCFCRKTNSSFLSFVLKFIYLMPLCQVSRIPLAAVILLLLNILTDKMTDSLYKLTWAWSAQGELFWLVIMRLASSLLLCQQFALKDYSSYTRGSVDLKLGKKYWGD